MKTNRKTFLAAVAAFITAPFARGKTVEKQALASGPPPVDITTLVQAANDAFAKEFKIDPQALHDCGRSNALMVAIAEQITGDLSRFDLNGVNIGIRWVNIPDMECNPEGRYGYFRIHVVKPRA